ncbi:esterase/lipase family protein [Pseudomonas sp. 5P_3.1_Bac2]|uniref:esterase/lipase family protein n=1 Tax=Pseudomonas sp. 5P_3.1_Bac2 TaxID=2971617 RepID=UPI0021C5D04C|nr:alpha/beta fold hydrolase [Pseudomonas sp. 5P_3.1_Bac2]MCU1715677.1 alpha/beta fold hydrolase [Pseudomonas sp. 5P_3.1_Bac2]
MRHRLNPIPEHSSSTLSPSKLLLALESRALFEWLATPLALPWLKRQCPLGDGHAVMVMPGLLAGDSSTAPLRRFLSTCGYQVQGWQQGRNLGPRAGVMAALQRQLRELQSASDGKISLIGWSLGGIFARELARLQPEAVRQVISLGSPLYGEPQTSTNAWPLYQHISAGHPADVERGDCAPPVPTTSIFSRGDGVVGWRGSVETHGAQICNIQLRSGSHLGLGVNPLVWWVLAERLAQAEHAWQPYNAQGLSRWLVSHYQPR